MNIKRLILLAPLIVFLSCAAYGQTRGVEKQTYLNGPVQSMRIETGDLITMMGVGNSKPRVESRQRQLDYLYDEKGNLQESVRYSRGNVTQREVEVERKMKNRTYKPVLLNGIPVRVVDTMTVKFEVPKLGRGKW
jgi:hypothetical protein